MVLELLAIDLLKHRWAFDCREIRERKYPAQLARPPSTRR
jgi:hypothetical protein